MKRLPREFAHLFWDVDFDGVELERDANDVIARVLEYGRHEEVHWLWAEYGGERILHFFRSVPHPILTERIRQFWRAFFKETMPWPEKPSWRKEFSKYWND